MIAEIISCIKNKVNSFCDLDIKVFERDFTVNLSVPESLKKTSKIPLSKRGKISRFTRKSVNRLKFVARNLPHSFRKMVTLTYPSDFPCDGRVVKRDLDLYLKCLKRKYPGIKYLYTLEFQERGAPHFHILINNLYVSDEWSSVTWHRIIKSEDQNHLIYGSRVDFIEKSAAHYLSDYIRKLYQKIVPEDYLDVGRFWACSRNIIQSFQTLINYLPVSFVLKHMRVLKRYYQHKLKEYKSLKHPHGIKYKFKCVSAFKFNDSNDFLVNVFWPYFVDMLKVELNMVA